MNHNVVHAGKRTLYTWWKSMIEVAVPSTAAPVLLSDALRWQQASSSQRVGLKNSGREKLLLQNIKQLYGISCHTKFGNNATSSF